MPTRNLSQAASGLRASVFATLADRMKRLPPDFLPLHIGDTYRLPPEPARFEKLEIRPELYRYSHPFGLAPFLEALAEKLQRTNRLPAAPDWLQITCGATQALHCAALTVFDPGDEVLVLSPFWPLIIGVLRSAGAVPVQVPFGLEPHADIAALLETHRSPRTRGLYFANPNNPDGKVYKAADLQALAAYAQRHDLWVLSDEVYEDYLFDGREHLSIAALEGMAERTLTAFSFSKSFALAGNRLGYAVAAPPVMTVLRRVANHTVYNVCAALQQGALGAVREGQAFLEESRQAYQAARDLLHRPVEKLCPLPQGGAYVFPSLGSEEAMWSFLHRGLDEGLAMSPGEAFGEAYRDRVRICFTATPLEGIERAAAILQKLL